jgi:hypothetical protein
MGTDHEEIIPPIPIIRDRAKKQTFRSVPHRKKMHGAEGTAYAGKSRTRSRSGTTTQSTPETAMQTS